MSKHILLTVGSKEATDPRICKNYVNWVMSAFPDAKLTVVDGSDRMSIESLLSDVDGVVLSGGADIDPSHYEQSAHEKLGPVNTDRDAVEIAVLKHAITEHIPVLGVCRGMQIANVFLGGTLFQDLESIGRPPHHRDKETKQERVHPIHLTEDSQLALVMGTTDLTVNSSHHQAVDRIGTGLKVAGIAQDGTVEALEGEDLAHHWVMLVQWHPERLEPADSSQHLIAAFFDRVHHS